MFNRAEWDKQARIIGNVLEKAEQFDKDYLLPPEEFTARQERTLAMLQSEGFDCGIVYSDEHYCGDVPYLAGNSNIIVEPVAAVLSPKGLYFIAGLESGIVAEQYCHRSGVNIRKVDIHRIGDSDYPKDLLTAEEILEEACGKKPGRIAILTAPGVFPVRLFSVLEKVAGRENIADLSKAYYRIKYEKSDNEMRLIEESCRIADAMLEGMLRILRPGLRETQVAQWGHAIARELGAEGLGFDVMVTSARNNRTIVARASNTVIKEGDVVHIGVSPKRDGLCGAERASVMCVSSPEQLPESYRVWMGFLEEAFQYAVDTFSEIALLDLPGCEHEKHMIAFYDKKAPELERRLGIRLPNFSSLKGYVTTHNSGYTECQEFYGALSCTFDERLANQLVMMMDVGLQGFYDTWDDNAIEGLDYLVIEKTLGKFGKRTRILNRLPVNLQYLVGENF